MPHIMSSLGLTLLPRSVLGGAYTGIPTSKKTDTLSSYLLHHTIHHAHTDQTQTAFEEEEIQEGTLVDGIRNLKASKK